MKIIIVGAGKTGRRVAAHLSANYDVVVIDRNPDIVNELNYSLDVLAVEGDATVPKTLENAGVEKAHYLITTTESDQTNIIVCSLAKTLGNPFTVARIHNMDYLTVWGKNREALGVGLMVCSIPLVAMSIANVIEFPSLRILRNIYGPLYVAEVSQKPKNLWSVKVGNRHIIIGTMEELRRTFKPKKPRRVLVMGASETGVLVSDFLLRKGCEVKLVEKDRDRAEMASEYLDDATVILGDVFDPILWEKEALYDAEVAVVAFKRDADNLFGALLAQKMGIGRVFARVREGRFTELFEDHGITAVSPEVVTADRIVIATQEKNVLGIVAAIPGVKVLALKVDDELAGKSSKDIKGIVGPIIRDGEILMPMSDNMSFQRDDVLTLVVPEED